MHKYNKLPKDVSGRLLNGSRSLKTFLSVLTLVVTARSILAFLSRTRKDQPKEKTILDRTAVQIALFPVLLPRIYSYLRKRLGTSGLAEALSSTLLLLLPSSWRIHVVLYAVFSALDHSARTSRTKQYLPPTWTLNIVGNALLLWAFLFKNKAFPSAYEKVILSNSTYYVPGDMTKPELEKLLCSATFSETDPKTSDSQRHAYDLCSKLHPTEPSCLKNYIKACIAESLQTCWWVGCFSGLPFMISKQQRGLFRRNPSAILQKWLTSTVRGTIFVSASITTAWGMTCLLQRLLPKYQLRRARWLINATVASLWILILSNKRRNEISLYVVRLAALCAWRAWRLNGGASLPFGDVFLFAVSWVQLVNLQRKGEKISGIVGYAMTKVE